MTADTEQAPENGEEETRYASKSYTDKPNGSGAGHADESPDLLRWRADLLMDEMMLGAVDVSAAGRGLPSVMVEPADAASPKSERLNHEDSLSNGNGYHEALQPPSEGNIKNQDEHPNSPSHGNLTNGSLNSVGAAASGAPTDMNRPGQNSGSTDHSYTENGAAGREASPPESSPPSGLKSVSEFEPIDGLPKITGSEPKLGNRNKSCFRPNSVMSNSPRVLKSRYRRQGMAGRGLRFAIQRNGSGKILASPQNKMASRPSPLLLHRRSPLQVASGRTLAPSR